MSNFNQKKNEILSRFENGNERYMTSAVFNKAVNALILGVDPYKIIDNLCQMSDEQQKAFFNYLKQ